MGSPRPFSLCVAVVVGLAGLAGLATTGTHAADPDRLAGMAVCDLLKMGDTLAREGQFEFHDSAWPMDPVLERSDESLAEHPETEHFRHPIWFWPAKQGQQLHRTSNGETPPPGSCHHCGCNPHYSPPESQRGSPGLYKSGGTAAGAAAKGVVEEADKDCDDPSLAAMLAEDIPALGSHLGNIMRYAADLARYQVDDVVDVLAKVEDE